MKIRESSSCIDGKTFYRKGLVLFLCLALIGCSNSSPKNLVFEMSIPTATFGQRGNEMSVVYEYPEALVEGPKTKKVEVKFLVPSQEKEGTSWGGAFLNLLCTVLSLCVL